MKRLPFLLSTCAIAAMLATGCASRHDISAPQQRTTHAIHVRWNTPVELDSALSLFRANGVTPRMTVHEFELAGQPWRSFLPLRPSENPRAAASRLRELHAGFLRDEARLMRASNNSFDAVPAELLEQQQRLAVACEAAVATSATTDLPVIEMTGVATDEMIRALRHSSRFTLEVLPAPEDPSQVGSDATSGLRSPAPAIAAVPVNNWVPRTGRVTLGAASSTARFVQVGFAWDNVTGFTGNCSIEPDFRLSNVSPSLGTYMDRSKIPDWLVGPDAGMPIFEYASSALPRAYVDTRFREAVTAPGISYTIGCADATLIKRAVLYYSYMRVKNGDTNNDSASLLMQYGHRVPSGVYSTWSCYGYPDSWAGYSIFDRWKIGVPCDFWWTR